MIGGKNIEELLKSSNLIFKRGWDKGYEAGRKEAYVEFRKIIKDAEKLAMLTKQAE